MADEQIRVEFVADTSKLKKGTKDAKKELEGVDEKVEKSQSIWKRLSSSLSGISPTFKGLSDTFNDVTDGMNDAFRGTSKSAKAMKVVTIAAVAAVAAQAVKAVWNIMSETAKAFDSKEYDKAVAKREVSMRKFKTAVGAFTSPIVNALNKAFSAILDGLTWVLKQIYAAFNLVYGFLKGLLTPVIDAIKSGIDAIANALETVVNIIKNAINSLAGFLGFGPVFKESTEGAKDMADATEEVGEEAEYAEGALQSFDKLNTMDTSGDKDTSEEMKNTAEEMQKIGQGWAEKLLDKLGGIADWFGDLGDKLGDLWDGFTQWAGDAWDSVKEKAGEVWDSITEWAGNLWDGFVQWAGNAWNTIVSVATSVWNTIVSIVTTAWNTILSVATTVWNIINSVATTVWNGIQSLATTVWNVIQTVATTVWDAISTPILAVWKTFQTLGEKCWSILQTAGEKFNQYIIDPIKSVIKWCVDKIKWVLDKIESAKNFLRGIGDKIGGAIGGAIDTVKGWFGAANGAVIEPNDPQLVMVGDNRREQEVISPLSTIRQAVSEALSAYNSAVGSSSTSPREIVLQVDGKVIARAMYDDLVAESNRRGRGTIA